LIRIYWLIKFTPCKWCRFDLHLKIKRNIVMSCLRFLKIAGCKQIYWRGYCRISPRSTFHRRSTHARHSMLHLPGTIFQSIETPEIKLNLRISKNCRFLISLYSIEPWNLVLRLLLYLRQIEEIAQSVEPKI